MFHRYPRNGAIESSGIAELSDVAHLHTLGAYIMLAFVLVHVYLITTGHTLTSNLKAMITGWEKIEEGDENVQDPAPSETGNTDNQKTRLPH